MQTRYILPIFEKTLHELDVSLENVVRTRMYVVDIDAHADVRSGKAYGEIFKCLRPAATMMAVAGLIAPELLVEIEADAVLPTSLERLHPQNEH